MASGDLVETCQRQRADHGLPNHFVSIAELDDLDTFLVLDCSPANQGRLLRWFELDEGFRHRDAEYSNATDLYFAVDQIFSKFGPAKNRRDRDGMFCQLYYSCSDPRNGQTQPCEYRVCYGGVSSGHFKIGVTIRKGDPFSRLVAFVRSSR